MSHSNSHISLKNLSYNVGNRSLFNEINLTVKRGSITAIMGPSGSGKTTLLRLMGGALVPDSGQVTVSGHNISRLTRSELYDLRRQMGVLFQSGALFTNYSVFDNVAFPIREHTDFSEPMIRDLVLLKLEAVGLRGAAQMMPAELSGGMARRVALARAIALDPDLVMYDEPFAGQDPVTTGVLMKLIRDLNDALGLTSIIVSHDVVQTVKISDDIYVISESEIIAHGKPKELLASEQENVKQFLHGLPDGSIPFHYPGPPIEQELML